jgi:hypothetical protein
VRTALAALTVLYLAAHLPFLPGTLHDLDAINFAMGVREFDVRLHQPHPPGYPIFIAAGKLSTPVLAALGVSSAEARGLALWSALGGALLIPALFALFRALDGSSRRAWWATLLTVASPLVWFSALRPLSDIAGLAAAVAAQILLVRAITGPGSPTERTDGSGTNEVFFVRPSLPSFLRVNPFSSSAPGLPVLAGALLAGLSIGIRSQNFTLTLPLLALALVMPGAARGFAPRALAVGAFAAGIAAWALPLVIASGGPAAYFGALGQQGGEDFGGVVMFWNFPTVAVGLSALWNTVIAPWASPLLAAIVLAAAAAGTADLARHRRVAVILAAMALPYALFHLLFHETVTVRYALPLVPVFAWLAVRGVDRFVPVVMPVVILGVTAWALVLAVPASVRYGTSEAPIFRAIDDLNAVPRQSAATVASHRRILTESRRARTWLGEPPGAWLPAPRDFEWLELTRAWRSGTADAAWFFADPRRTDLALIDSRSARVVPYRWSFEDEVFVGGARPGEFDVHSYTSPGWFLEEGWALTPEVAGVSAREGWMPHLRPSVGWIRRHAGAADMVLGGRHLGGPGDPPLRLVATIDGRTVLDRETPPGFFVQRIELAPGALSGQGDFARLEVRVLPLTGNASRLELEQFDVQPDGVPMFAFETGWQEPEYKPETGMSWRWMSRRGDLWIRPIGRDVTLTLRAESPLRYFDASPVLRLSASGQELGRLTPSDDFTWQVTIPAERLAASGGRVVIESDTSFVPGGATGGDRRELALRVYAVAVN